MLQHLLTCNRDLSQVQPHGCTATALRATLKSLLPVLRYIDPKIEQFVPSLSLYASMCRHMQGHCCAAGPALFCATWLQVVALKAQYIRWSQLRQYALCLLQAFEQSAETSCHFRRHGLRRGHHGRAPMFGIYAAMLRVMCCPR